MKRNFNPLPKKQYFLNRLQSAIADQDQGKQIYYLSRYKGEVENELQAAKREIAELKLKTAPKKRGELKKKEFVFTFKSGGWNSVFAKTKRGAEKLMKEQYGDMDPIPGSCHVASEKEYMMLLSLSN
jgi:hypothetical protein